MKLACLWMLEHIGGDSTGLSSAVYVQFLFHCDSNFYFPYEGPYSGRGPRKKYGSKLDYRNIADRYRQSLSVEKGIQTVIYQMPMWHKRFADQLNIVVIVKTNLRTGAVAHVGFIQQ